MEASKTKGNYTGLTNWNEVSNNYRNDVRNNNWNEVSELQFKPDNGQQLFEPDFLNQFFYVTTLKLPAGYKVSYLPESQSFSNDAWGFSLSYLDNKKEVSLVQQFDTSHMMLYPDQFE